MTTLSNATARTMPSWCSVASMWRVPNRTLNRANSSRTSNAVSAPPAPVTGSAAGPISAVTLDGHRLELERDVGDRSQDRHDGDQAGQDGALAVAGGDEVGDRGDALRLGDPQHLLRPGSRTAGPPRSARDRSAGSPAPGARPARRCRRRSRRCSRRPATACRHRGCGSGCGPGRRVGRHTMRSRTARLDRAARRAVPMPAVSKASASRPGHGQGCERDHAQPDDKQVDRRQRHAVRQRDPIDERQCWKVREQHDR